MRPLVLTATTIVSAIGRGSTATLETLRSRRSGLVPCDFADVRNGYIGRVLKRKRTRCHPALPSTAATIGWPTWH